MTYIIHSYAKSGWTRWRNDNLRLRLKKGYVGRPTRGGLGQDQKQQYCNTNTRIEAKLYIVCGL